MVCKVRAGMRPSDLIVSSLGRSENDTNPLPTEDSQATVCAPEDTRTLAQDEQEPSSSQTLACSTVESTCTAMTTKRKGSPEVDLQLSERPRKTVRISDFSCGAEAAPASTPHAKRTKQEEQRAQKTPYLDLRKMTSSKRATESGLDYEPLDASGARKIACVF